MIEIPIKKIDNKPALEVFESVAHQPYALWFDSNRPSHPLNQWSYICWEPVEIITVKSGKIFIDDKLQADQDIFQFLQDRLDSYHFTYPKNNIPFTGGIAGCFGYDLGRELEGFTTHNIKDDLNIPDLMVGIYSNIIAFDHAKSETWVVGKKPEKHARKPITNNSTLEWKTNKSDADYLNDIQHVIDEIHAGEVYQANLTRRFEVNLPNNYDAFAHYKKLRDINPAPFSAFMNFDDVQISSCSPEQFLNVKDNVVETRPIKGTLPLSQPVEALLNSKKDRAENTMIVDLLRNDLSKVCDFHSVKVPQLCVAETFEGLHHLVSTVRGVLQKDKTALDALQACFPGGSITGAPKRAAMNLIEKLEPTRRGPYCGSLGMIGFNGDMNTSITIRTLIYAGNKAYLQSGGGIVSDSIPDDELKESLNKIQKIFDSFETEKESAA